jgi:hypothetical protein
LSPVSASRTLQSSPIRPGRSCFRDSFLRLAAPEHVTVEIMEIPTLFVPTSPVSFCMGNSIRLQACIFSSFDGLETNSKERSKFSKLGLRVCTLSHHMLAWHDLLSLDPGTRVFGYAMHVRSSAEY